MRNLVVRIELDDEEIDIIASIHKISIETLTDDILERSIKSVYKNHIAMIRITGVGLNRETKYARRY